ncbi:hypothetical protein AGMMS50229_04970 [Campylobacterota bacterium]|nr:hypothetical protein AGMMS50229_04970 [Campylobacterota bacterium]
MPSTNLKSSSNAVILRFNDPYLFRVMDEAAELLNLSRTSYILSVIRKDAEATIKKRKQARREIETLILSPEASIDFAKTVLKPSKPNEALKNAAEAYKTANIKHAK